MNDALKFVVGIIVVPAGFVFVIEALGAPRDWFPITALLGVGLGIWVAVTLLDGDDT